jgi:hypothetical protein
MSPISWAVWASEMKANYFGKKAKKNIYIIYKVVPVLDELSTTP